MELLHFVRDWLFLRIKVVPENEWVILQRFRILKKLYLT